MEYTHLLFQDVGFMLGSQEKVGLIGLNGTGKSTLMKIIAGVEKADKGTIEITPNEHIEYLPQEFTLSADEANEFVGEYLEALVKDPKTEMHRVNRQLAKLDFGDVDLYQYISTLSPGQKMKLYLTKLLVNEPTILLLDEPTNHLDINGILWLEKFVKQFEGIVIMISHDRSFLNTVIDTVFEIDEKKLYVWKGNYDDFVMHKIGFKEERARLFKAQERKRAQMEKLLENARKVKDGKKRSKKVSAAKKRMEREVTSKEIGAYEELRVSDIDIAGNVYRTKKILEVKDLSFAYDPSRPILDNIDWTVYGSQKLWLIGPNGIGKSTLIKLLIGQLSQSTGEIKWGNAIRWDYFAQDQAHIPMDKTVEGYFLEQTNVSYTQSFGLMEQFLFDKEYRDKKIGKLSPGQRARLAFAIFSLHEYECLILDEPTNHLDIETKEVIEQALRNFKGSIILISHDRYFAESIEPDQILTLEEGRLININ